MTQKSTDKSADSAPKGNRIAKVLARAGVASRRDVERMIEAGRVSVNGEKVLRAALNVTDHDNITVDGKPVGEPDAARLWLYHKPAGLVTTDRDEKGRETIYNKMPEDLPRVLAVGRLDINSEGLLLLTNDGGIKRQLELPSTGWLRRY
ncbi:MAG: S4 domain-containing protein, partial [Erythrobacter sp.]